MVIQKLITVSRYVQITRGSSFSRKVNQHCVSEMTIQKCLSICRSKKFQFAGLEWSMECYCGNEPDNGFKWAWPGKCNSPCGGNLEQICGGSRAMSVYSVATDGICIMDFPNSRRVLDRYSVTGDENMTVELCRDICIEKSTRYYGVENGDECYCGDNDEGKDIRKTNKYKAMTDMLMYGLLYPEKNLFRLININVICLVVAIRIKYAEGHTD